MEEEKENNSEETPVKKAPKEKNYNIVFFIIILLLSIIGISVAYIHNTNDFNERQNNIINAQNIQISRIDSALSKFYSHSINIKNDSLCYYSIFDTLNKSKYNSQAKIDSITISVIRASIKAGATKELADQLRKDSIFVHTQIGQIQNDTKSLLTLEFNKIQNEYQELQLWGGILTIVFLIFTFYSLFKTDDLMKQGRDGVDKLYLIQEKADKLIVDQKLKAEESLEGLRKKTESELKVQQDSIAVVKAQLDQSTKDKAIQLEQITEDFQKRLTDEFESQKTKFTQELENYKKQWQDLLEDMKEFSPKNGDEKTPDDNHEDNNPANK